MFVEFFPLFLMVLLALGLALSLLKIAELIGPHQPNAVKESPYESGQDPVGSARDRYSVKFYLVAMIFIVFDVELVFLYPWAVSYGTFLEAGGAAALASMSVIGVFILILLVGLLYDVKKGGLDWD
ncbi:NADH-quinone oxidoreductase subunit A [Rubrivirga sp. IMCC43871]|uniref:NADH-quinone oxidoreductase subunit A n=1 Tax=Rubrivirga sp. IMCC43871 TaxID=3391575 RepID=UPI00398FA44B